MFMNKHGHSVIIPHATSTRVTDGPVEGALSRAFMSPRTGFMHSIKLW